MFGLSEFRCCGEDMDPTTDPDGRFTHTCPDCGHVIEDFPTLTTTTLPTPADGTTVAPGRSAQET